MTTQLLLAFLFLLLSHALCDYPLQGAFLSKAKWGGRTPYLRAVDDYFPWQWALFWHSYMHAMGVLLVTQNLWAALAELVAHAGIDYLKCEGKFGVTVDQLLHVITKVLILLVLTARRLAV